jgi:MYXO-CTERM domain-containing protein
MNDGASLARHGQAFANARHPFDSVSREGLSSAIRISDYRFADYVAGRGMRAGVSLGADEMRVLRSFSQSGGALLLSGSHVASDLAAGGADERAFLSDVLKAQAGSSPGTLVVEGSDGTLLTDLTGIALDDGTQGSYRVEPLGSVAPTGSEVIATFLPSGAGAAVATRKGPKVVFLAFPLEGVVNPTLRDQIVARVLSSIEPDRPPQPDAGAPAIDAGLPAVGDPASADAGLDAPPLPKLPWSGAGGDAAPRGCGCATGADGTPDPTPTALLLAAASIVGRRKMPWVMRVRRSS